MSYSLQEQSDLEDPATHPAPRAPVIQPSERRSSTLSTPRAADTRPIAQRYQWWHTTCPTPRFSFTQSNWWRPATYSKLDRWDLTRSIPLSDHIAKMLSQVTLRESIPYSLFSKKKKEGIANDCAMKHKGH